MDGKTESYHSVIVVGAGIAGLYAAHKLQQHFPDVLVVEAQNHVGGRIRQLHGYSGWPIEVGPEFIHGSKSKFTELMEQYGFRSLEKPWPNYWYFGKQKLLTDDEGVANEVEKLHEWFEAVGDVQPPPPGQDVSAEDWLKAKGASELQLELASVCYANDFGCSLKQLGLREMITENQRWDSGETYLIMDQSISTVIDKLQAGLRIRTNCPIMSIRYDQGGATLSGPNDVKLGARKVVITASLAVLQAGKLQFSPKLPAAKQAALSRLRMGNAAKIVVAFNHRFWPERLYDVICTHCFVPEFWMTQHATTDISNQHLHAVVGFIAGERTIGLRHMSQQAAVQKFLDQLDEIFGTAEQLKPASSAYVKATMFDWSQEEWVGGAYSYPSLGAEEGDREALAAPVSGTLFFAGEATHPAVNPCMQAALETAERAALQIRAALSQPVSKL